MPLREALSLVETDDLDLVEVAPEAQPPVCRIMNYGKFRYLQKKKDQGGAGGGKSIPLYPSKRSR